MICHNQKDIFIIILVNKSDLFSKDNYNSVFLDKDCDNVRFDLFWVGLSERKHWPLFAEEGCRIEEACVRRRTLEAEATIGPQP